MNQDEGEFKKRIYELIFRFPTGDGYVVYDQKLLGLLDEVRKEFPVKFEWQVMIGENEDGSGIFETQVMPNAKLPENRANARIEKEKVLDWFLRVFGSGDAEK